MTRSEMIDAVAKASNGKAMNAALVDGLEALGIVKFEDEAISVEHQIRLEKLFLENGWAMSSAFLRGMLMKANLRIVEK